MKYCFFPLYFHIVSGLLKVPTATTTMSSYVLISTPRPLMNQGRNNSHQQSTQQTRFPQIEMMEKTKTGRTRGTTWNFSAKYEKGTDLIRASLVERSSSARSSRVWSTLTRLESIFELFLIPNWLRFSVPSPSLRTLPAEMRLIESGLALDRRATSALSIGTVHCSSSTSSTPAQVPATFNFAMREVNVKVRRRRRWIGFLCSLCAGSILA